MIDGEKQKKPDWWPKNPYPEDIFPMPRRDYAKVVPDPDRRTALSGMLGREFWGIASQSIWDALRDHLEDLEDASSLLQPPALPSSAQAKIEAAIRYFKVSMKNMKRAIRKAENEDQKKLFRIEVGCEDYVIEFGKWILGQKSKFDGILTDADFETKN